MEESPFNKFKEDKLRVLQALETKELLQPQGETMQLVKQSSAWFKEKLMLAEAQEAAFQTEDLDAYNSDYDDISSAKAVLMANLSSCDLDVLSKINSDSNIIPYSQYLQESQDASIQDTNSFAPNDLLVLSLVEQMTDHVANLDKENQTNKMVNESLTAQLERYKERNAKLAAFQQEIDTLKETLSTHVKENESLAKTLTVFKTESKEKEQAMHMLTKPQVLYDDTHKQALGYQNPFNLKKAQRIKPTLYDGIVIVKEHAVISVIDDEEMKRSTV
ncbi:hypothetical protein Tco_1173807 [Tanacetum coccineum]